MQDLLSRAALIQLVIFDVDGVLTDGRLYFGDDGNTFNAFYSRDGQGIKMLLDAGIEVAIISGRHADSVEHRMNDLGIRHAHLGVRNKLEVFEQLQISLNISAERIAYVGDDLIDLPVMIRVGLAISVQDADPFVASRSHWQTPHRGGRGAARDVCELLLESRGQLNKMRCHYL
jgi:3-deoxy-D-manno-octulosonate 8-phosphate phosphatase (KDO 8-P phosphatase)